MADRGAGTEAVARTVSLLWPGERDFRPVVHTASRHVLAPGGPWAPSGTGEEIAEDKRLVSGLPPPPPHRTQGF